MKKIASFTINHDTLTEGLYTSRVDGDIVTYDIRMRKPNNDDFLATGAIHTVEHLFATYVRNSKYADDVIYFGPMGCQTGFYLLIRNADHIRVFEEIKTVLKNILEYNGEVFGNSEIECGNYRTLDLRLAHYEAKKYLAVLNDWTDMSFSYNT